MLGCRLSLQPGILVLSVHPTLNPRLVSRVHTFRRPLLLVLLLVIVTLYLSVEPWLPLRLHCVIKSLTGVPCPGCGTIRSLQLLLHGDLVGSVLTNPLGLLLAILSIAAVTLMVRDVRKNDDMLYRLMHRRWPPLALAVVVLLTLANWLWNISKGL